MDNIILKKKSYEVLEKLGEQTTKVSFKGKTFVIKEFHVGSEEFEYFLVHYKHLKISGVRIPKVLKIDKKAEKVLLEYIEGENVFDVLSKKDLDDEYYKRIFEQSWLAENDRLSLDYHPDHWIMSKNNEIVYTKFDYDEGINEAQNFKTTQVKLWFFTKEFYNYAKSKGVELDSSRLKDEYKMNKEIVLKVVKYYV